MTREEAVARIKDHIEIHRYHERNAVKIFEALDMAIKALEQPEPHWIPCSERLPERPEQMLVYAINTHFSIAKYKEVRKGVNDYIYTWVTDNAFDVPHEVKNVIAWMPLPESYRAERRTDDT